MFTRQSQARDRAEEVQQLMDDPSVWDIIVWNNQDWHFQLSAKNIGLHESDVGGGFWAMVSPDPTRAYTGLSAWTPEGETNYTDPNEAVKVAVQAAVDYALSLASAANAANEIVLSSTKKVKV